MSDSDSSASPPHPPPSPDSAGPSRPTKKRKTAKPAAGRARNAEEWCVRCVRALLRDRQHLCCNQDGAGERCYSCSSGNRTCTVIPFPVRAPLARFLEDEDREDLLEAVRLLPVDSAGAQAQRPQHPSMAGAAASQDELLSLVSRGVVALESIAREMRTMRRLAEAAAEEKSNNGGLGPKKRRQRARNNSADRPDDEGDPTWVDLLGTL